MQTRKKRTLYTFALLGMLLILNSCKKEYESIQSIDDAKIQAYIKQNNLTMTKDESGFYYQVITQGTGAPLAYKDSVLYNLEVKSLTGTSYVSSTAYTNEGNYLGYLTPSSYRIALLGAKRGGKVRVILPSYLAYGKNGYGNVPSNEVIVSEITTSPYATQWQIDDARIASFLASKGITAAKHSSRVYYQVLTAGTGTDAIDEHSTVNYKYTGRLLDGTVFDSSTSFSTTLSSVVSGWAKIMPLFTSGAKIRIFIPSDLAYGTTAYSSIPANSVLDFDIEIVSVTN